MTITFTIIPGTISSGPMFCLNVHGREMFIPYLRGGADEDDITVPEFRPVFGAVGSWEDEVERIREMVRPLAIARPIRLNTHKTMLARSLRHMEIEVQIVANALVNIDEANNARFWRVVPNSLAMWALHTKTGKFASLVRFLKKQLGAPVDQGYEEELAKMYTPWPVTYKPLRYWHALRYDARLATLNVTALVQSLGSKLEVLAVEVLRTRASHLPPP